MAKILIFTIIFVILASFVSAICIEPSDNMLINENTVLCKGDYRLDNGITIKGSQIYLDCNNSVIEGDFEKSGITVEGFDISIKNCKIMYFEKGIEAKKSKLSLINTILAKNSIGIYNIDSIVEYVNSSIDDNLDMIINISIPGGKFLMFEDINLTEADYSRLIQVPNIFSDEAFALLDLSSEELATEEDVIAEVFRQYADDYTKYTIKVIPLKNLVDAKVFIHVPKLVAPDHDYVAIPEDNIIRYEIVNIEPAQYVFYLNDIVTGEEKNIEIIIKRRVIQNIDVSAIVAYSKTLTPLQNFLVMTLFGSAIVLYFVNKHFKKNIKENIKHL